MTVTDHWAILCHPAWGHVRHMNGFLARSLRRRRQDSSLGISYLLHHTHTVKASIELKQLLLEEGESEIEASRLVAKVRFVGLVAPAELKEDEEFQSRFQAASTTSIRYGMEFDAAFEYMWDGALTSSTSLQCGASGQEYSYKEWTRPSVVHTDIVSESLFLADICDSILTWNEQYGGPNIQYVKGQARTVYHWSTEFVSFWRMFMHDEYSQGGIEDAVASERELSVGKEFYDECHKRYNDCTNQLLEIPGLINGMYDYEVNPGQSGWPRSYIPALYQLKKAVSLADAVVVASCEELQPGCPDLVSKELMDRYGTELYAIGPSIEDNLLKDVPLSQSANPSKDGDVLEFMDRCLAQIGPKSVALLSWGTIWAPFMYPDLLEAWLDEVIQTRRPFILNRSAELFSKLSPWLEEKLNTAEKAGLLCQTTWIPQRRVLRHAGLGVFVSHCGYSSASESPVPIIGWPSFFDQSIIAQQLQDHDLGWQLYQVRGPNAIHQKCRTLELKGESVLGTVEAVRREARQILAEASQNSKVYQRKAKNLSFQRARLYSAMSRGGHVYDRFNQLISGS